MHIDFLVEEPSVEAMLQHIIPSILGEQVDFRLIVFGSKSALLKLLPDRLRGYAPWIPDDYRIVVLVDEDRQECRELKNHLETAAIQAGLTTKSSSIPGTQFHVLNRIVIEELEACFFGDIAALCQAYPRIPATLARRESYRDPDAIRGGTWEALERELQRAGYYQGGLAKTQAAREISLFMDVQQNRSRSFRVFVDGLLAMQMKQLS